MSYLVGNPEDRFPRDAAQVSLIIISSMGYLINLVLGKH